MALDKRVIPELVKHAQQFKDTQGADKLETYTADLSWCGCMGPQPGEYLCPCAQREALQHNLIEVVSHFDEKLAKKIMLRRLVAALPG